MEKVFISYRREDSQWPADRIYEALKRCTENPDFEVFIDVDGIPLGMDFHEHLDAKVAQCDVLLALIGHGWLEAKDANTGARRLEDSNDFVRIEIASALKRNIPVVPVLLDGAQVPNSEELPEGLKPLSRRNGVEIKRVSFKADIERLVKGLGLDEQNSISVIEAVRDEAISSVRRKQVSPRPAVDKANLVTEQSGHNNTNSNHIGSFGKIILAVGLITVCVAAYFAYNKYLAVDLARSSPEIRLTKEKHQNDKSEQQAKLIKEKAAGERTTPEAEKKRLAIEAGNSTGSEETEKMRPTQEKPAFGSWSGVGGGYDFIVKLGKDYSTMEARLGKYSCKYKLVSKSLIQDLKIGDEIQFTAKILKGSAWLCDRRERLRLSLINTNHMGFKVYQLGGIVKVASGQLTRNK